MLPPFSTYMRLLLLWIFLGSSSLFAQESELRFEHFSITDGLPHLSVQAIHQDHLGYLWVGTWDGLARYDGQHFKTFFADPFEQNSLCNSNVNSICEDANNRLWLGTESGVSRYNRSVDNFVRFKTSCKEGALCGRRNRVLFSEDQAQLWVYPEFRSNDFFTYQAERDIFLKSRSIKLPQGYWSGVKSSIQLSTPEPSELAFIKEALKKVARGKVPFFPFLTSDNCIWAGMQNGLFKYENGKFKPITSIPKAVINSILEDKKGTLWVGTAQGLFYLEKNSQQWKTCLHNPKIPHSLRDNNILCLYEDRLGNLWVGTQRGGLSRLKLYQPQLFRSFDLNTFSSHTKVTVFSLLKTKDTKEIWVGSNEGIFIFDHKSGKLLHHFTEGLISKRVYSLWEDEQQRVWASGSFSELLIFDTKSKKQIKIISNNSLLESGSHIRKIIPTLDGKIYILSNRGIFVSDEKQEGKQLFGYLYGNNKYLLSWDLDIIDSCNIYISNNFGLLKYNHCKQKTTEWIRLDSTVKYSYNVVFCTHIDSQGFVWMGNWGGGLNRLDRISGKLRHYGLKDGLASNHIYGILEDKKAELWLSTNAGISRFNPRSEAFIQYTKADGLPDNEFASGAYFQAEDGEMYFGGINGFVCFYPQQIQEKTARQKLEVSITSVRISGVDFVAPQAIEKTQNIKFLYRRQQSLKIGFSDFDFRKGQRSLYRYRLLGYEDKWNPPSSNSKARYTQLPPGNYTFQLAVAGSDGNFGREKQLFIRIRPLLHQRLWFQILLGFLALLLLVSIVYYRVRYISRHERLRLRHKAAMAKQEALAAQFDHHFTFNSLNSIQRFISQNEKEKAIRYIARFGKLIRRVMNQARQSSITIEEEVQTLELYLSLEQLRTKNRFTYSIDIDPAIDTFNTELPSMLIQPFIENAIWHGMMPLEGQGILQLEFHHQRGHLLIAIQDNGIGRQQSFAQKSDSILRHESRGMALVRERLQAMNKSRDQQADAKIFDLEDAEGRAVGTRIELLLPLE